jgi:FMN reductase
MLDALRDADGLLVASPGYHGSMSGLVKNALDYIEGLRDDTRCYLDDVPVGCIVSAAGSQAGGSTLAALRSVIHSLRGWPTPLGVTFNSISSPFDQNGNCSDEALVAKLTELTTQVILMARLLGSRRSGNTGQ